MGFQVVVGGRLEIAAEVAAAAEVTPSSTPIAAPSTEVATSIVVTAASARIAAEVSIIPGRGVGSTISRESVRAPHVVVSAEHGVVQPHAGHRAKQAAEQR